MTRDEMIEQWRIAMYPHIEAPMFAFLLADTTATGWDELRNEIDALVEITAALRSRPAPPDDRGSWPSDYLGRAFVSGAKWWQFHHNGATAFPTEIDEMEAEALKRYALAAPAPVAAPAPPDDLVAKLREADCWLNAALAAPVAAPAPETPAESAACYACGHPMSAHLEGTGQHCKRCRCSGFVPWPAWDHRKPAPETPAPLDDKTGPQQTICGGAAAMPISGPERPGESVKYLLHERGTPEDVTAGETALQTLVREMLDQLAQWADDDWMDRAVVGEFRKRAALVLAAPVATHAPLAGDREATCAWDCTQPYPHQGTCSAPAPETPAPDAMPKILPTDLCWVDNGYFNGYDARLCPDRVTSIMRKGVVIWRRSPEAR